MTATKNIDQLLKKAVEKDLAFIEDKIKSFKSIADVVELDTHFYDFESVTNFFDELKSWLKSYEHFIPRIEGIYKYDNEDDEDEEHFNDLICFNMQGGGDDVYNWGLMIEACAKNTLNLIMKLGGKVVVYDSGSGWEWNYG
jgi:hypothetical protein